MKNLALIALFCFISISLYSQTEVTADTVIMSQTNGSINPNSLYNGHNYNHYQKVYEKASHRKLGGIYMSAIGLGAIAASYIMKNSAKSQSSVNVVFFTGAIFFEIGLPIWIANGMVASNNKRAMEMTQRNTNLTFGTTSDGIGFVFSFN